MDALVTDVQLRNAVAGLRGLGRAGLEVIALAPRPGAAGLRSGYAARRALAPPPKAGGGGFAAEIGRLAVEHGPLVVYPGPLLRSAPDHGAARRPRS